MDSLFGRLIVAALVLSLAWAMPVRAQTNPPYTDAMAACQARVVTYNAGTTTAVGHCEDDVAGAQQILLIGVRKSDGLRILVQVYKYSGVKPPDNPCAGMKNDGPRNQVGKVLKGYGYCADNAQPNGSTVKCGMKWTPTSDPVRNEWGNWNTFGVGTPTGELCGAGPGAGGGWTDASGAPPADPPPPPAPPPPDDPPKDPPKLCGKVSCYNPKDGTYCTQGSAGPICASGPPPNPGGSGPPADGGSCSSGGDVTVCTGKPQAPPPPPGKVPDPPTATGGTDKYTHADGSTGAPYQTTTTVYNNGSSGSISNGASSGDTKPPASSSSTGGSGGTGDDPTKDPTGASGGGDCSNPPFVSGSAALGMVAMQAWQTRCATEKVHKDLSGDGTSPGDISTPSGTSPWVDVPASGDGVADAANKGNYDMSGMGFSTSCPMHDLQVPLPGGRSFAIAFSKGCDVGGWIRALVIAFALFAAAKITVGGNN